jgi:hypothetical protein
MTTQELIRNVNSTMYMCDTIQKPGTKRNVTSCTHEEAPDWYLDTDSINRVAIRQFDMVTPNKEGTGLLLTKYDMSNIPYFQFTTLVDGTIHIKYKSKCVEYNSMSRSYVLINQNRSLRKCLTASEVVT